MSHESTLVDGALIRYVAEHATPDDAFLAALGRAAREAGIPSIGIAPEQASFMQILLRIAGAREVVEVGTLAGYSAIRLARALPEDGRLVTIEVEGRHADFAEHWIARSDVADRIEVLRGDGLEVLRGLAAESADATFIDADKRSYGGYLEQSLRILRPGGFVMADNAFAFGRLLDPRSTDPGVVALRRFNEHVAERTDIESVIVPLGDGLWVCCKR